jgi:hypothetical protein
VVALLKARNPLGLVYVPFVLPSLRLDVRAAAREVGPRPREPLPEPERTDALAWGSGQRTRVEVEAT